LLEHRNKRQPVVLARPSRNIADHQAVVSNRAKHRIANYFLAAESEFWHAWRAYWETATMLKPHYQAEHGLDTDTASFKFSPKWSVRYRFRVTLYR
jgi:hypothetical protein